LLLLFSGSIIAQKPDKVMSNNVFDAMDTKVQQDIDDDMDKARESFLKVLSKESENAMALFGLSVVYGYDEYTRRDYFESWKYFQQAEKLVANFDEDDRAVLNEYFFKQDKKRRNRPLNKNMDWERDLVEDKLIKFVREENNLEYANKFLQEFPDSKYHDNVVHIRNYIEFRKAENTATVAALQQFIKSYPDAAQVETAQEQCHAIAYKEALSKKSLSALRAFVKEYPNAVQVEDAKKLMGVMAYEEAAKIRSLEALEHFMTEFPNSSKMPEAKLLKRQLLFEWAKKVNTIDAYNQFVALYPEGEMYIDIFNLKASAMGQQLLMDFPMENYKFIKGYDNSKLTDYGGDLALRPNGELLVLANTRKAQGEMFDVWLLGLDAEGKMNWNKILGNPFDDQVNRIKVSDKNEIYAAGITNAIKDSIPGKAWIFKMDAKGKNIYNRKLDGSEVKDFAVYSDGKTLVGGYTFNTKDTSISPYLVKLNAQGKKLWDRTYTQGGIINSIALHPDNTAFIAGENWVFALDENGYLLWESLLEAGNKATAVNLDATGKVVFAGSAGSKGFAKAFDTQGNKVWETPFEMDSLTQITHITPLADLSIICSGNTPDQAILMTKIDQTGKVAASKKFSLPNGIKLNGIIEAGGNFVIVSATRLGAQNDILVFKLSL
jgi:outer membrane protein assembly factor BamD (BamD/ComL family)